MSLYDALKSRGLNFRQHLEEESWPRRKLTVVDLTEAQQEVLASQGIAGLEEIVTAQGVGTFPATDIKVLLPRQTNLLLAHQGRPQATVVAPQNHPESLALAQKLVQLIRQTHGVELPLLTDHQATAELLDQGSLILIGGSDVNRLAMEMALRFQTFFLDAAVPGQDGWAACTHLGLRPTGHAIAQCAAPSEHHDHVLACVQQALVAEDDRLLLKPFHQVHQGKRMSQYFPNWEKFSQHLFRHMPLFQSAAPVIPLEPEPLADLLAQGLHSGGVSENRYNLHPVTAIVTAAQYYQLSGDRRGLVLFRELLFRLLDYYLRTPLGASYISDFDFEAGLLVLYYSRLEHDAIFSEQDRLILANLLLACTRTVNEYARKCWPVTAGKGIRHNHETFPAISLLYAADYFRHYEVVDVPVWQEYTEAVFNSSLWSRFKQRENAALYEPLVPLHALMYSTYTGQGLAKYDSKCLHQIVRREMITTDNFLRQSDYGDTAVNMAPKSSVIARLLATQEDGLLRWYAWAGMAKKPEYLLRRALDFTGIGRLGDTTAPHQTPQWEFMPMDPHFAAEQMPGFPAENTFDKLAFRTGWGPQDHYLLIEGVSGKVSHGHHDAGGIVRLNHLGRHWVVSNGNGKLAQVTNSPLAYASRVTGPQDHNLLVLRQQDQYVAPLPPAEMKIRRQEGLFLLASVQLQQYGPVNWSRAYVVLPNQYVLVIDQVRVTGEGLQSGHVEYNILGNMTPAPEGCRYEQQGVYMHVSSTPQWSCENRESPGSADWQAALAGGDYPYASLPLTKLLFHLPSLQPGESHVLATFLAASLQPSPAYAMDHSDPERIKIASVGSSPQATALSSLVIEGFPVIDIHHDLTPAGSKRRED